MAYFTQCYERVQFIVAIDDLTWCKNNIMNHNRSQLAFSDKDLVLDFAMLSLCDHIIINVGSSFSWWAGWICTGITVYNGIKPRHGTFIEYSMGGGFYIPPDDEYNKWIPIE